MAAVNLKSYLTVDSYNFVTINCFPLILNVIQIAIQSVFAGFGCFEKKLKVEKTQLKKKLNNSSKKLKVSENFEDRLTKNI